MLKIALPLTILLTVTYYFINHSPHERCHENDFISSTFSTIEWEVVGCHITALIPVIDLPTVVNHIHKYSTIYQLKIKNISGSYRLAHIEISVRQ